MSAQKPPNEEQVSRNRGLDDADYYIKQVREAFEILQREATRVRQEKEAFNAMSKKFEHIHFSSTVNLNVGGHCFKTSVQTLTKDPNTMLAAMFSGKFEMKPCEDGAFFIDRDGTHFRFILNYLRTGKLTLPEGATFLKELQEEAEFYQIQGIIDKLRASEPTVQASNPAKPFNESAILTNENRRSVLKGWLSSQEGKWRLLFRASRDGFAAAAFHSKCDNKGPTVAIVKSGNNIFGGFTEVSWSSPSGSSLSGRSRSSSWSSLWWNGIEHKTCRDAFLFSMVNPRGLGPTKLPLKAQEQQTAICCYSSDGPWFGRGCDLGISNNANTSTPSYSNLGNTYELPPGQQSTFFTGSTSFTVTDYEVFGLHS